MKESGGLNLKIPGWIETDKAVSSQPDCSKFRRIAFLKERLP